jgi:hypothetical protein
MASGRCGAGAVGGTTSPTARLAQRALEPPRSGGARWMAGFGIDRALPLHSILFAADIIAERFVGLYDLVDWTVEVGLRRQLGTQMVLDVGVGRHFAGVVQSTSVTAGLSYGLPLRLLMRRTHGADDR